ncbi:hypothetical protein ACFL1S_02650 [Pseudomonadota bacterium]
MRFVPAFDEVKYGELCFSMGTEGVPVDELTFDRRTLLASRAMCTTVLAEREKSRTGDPS